MTKKTIPKSEFKYFVPKICATIPFVGGTVDNQRSPKVIPKIIELNIEGGEKINIKILIALKVYKILNKFFFYILCQDNPSQEFQKY